MASRFAASLRRQLYKDHLGLSAPQICPPVAHEPVTAAMRPVGVPQEDTTGSREDELVMVRWAMITYGSLGTYKWLLKLLVSVRPCTGPSVTRD